MIVNNYAKTEINRGEELPDYLPMFHVVVSKKEIEMYKKFILNLGRGYTFLNPNLSKYEKGKHLE